MFFAPIGSTPHDFFNLELRHHQYVLNVLYIFDCICFCVCKIINNMSTVQTFFLFFLRKQLFVVILWHESKMF